MIAATLTAQRDAIVDDALRTLRAAGSTHYETLSDDELRERLGALLDHFTAAIARHDAIPVVGYAALLAGARHDRGYRLVDVQTAFNSLEQAVWRVVVEQRPAATVADDLALVTSAFGLAKDELARAYVDLAAGGVPAVDVEALMSGTSA